MGSRMADSTPFEDEAEVQRAFEAFSDVLKGHLENEGQWLAIALAYFLWIRASLNPMDVSYRAVLDAAYRHALRDLRPLSHRFLRHMIEHEAAKRGIELEGNVRLEA